MALEAETKKNKHLSNNSIKLIYQYQIRYPYPSQISIPSQTQYIPSNIIIKFGSMSGKPSLDDGQLCQRDMDQNDDIEQLGDEINYNDMLVKKDIMIAIQGLGARRDVLNPRQELVTVYMPGKNCEQSLRVLCKLLKNERPEWPTAKLYLCRYNIIQSDLLELLLSQVLDRKISFWVMVLLSLMTSPPSDNLTLEDTETIKKANIEYKKSLLRREVWNTLLIHMTQIFESKHQIDANEQAFEAVFTLLRNCLVIENTEHDNFLHESFLLNLLRESTFDMILYILQLRKDKLVGRMALTMLEIVYLTFGCFNPVNMYSHNLNMKQLMHRDSRQESSRPTCSRHSRFMPYFERESNLGVKEIYHSLNHKPKNEPKIAQLLRPFKSAENKLVKSIQRPYMPMDALVQQIEGTNRSGKEMIAHYAGELLDGGGLNNLVAAVFDSIFRDDARVTDKLRINYMLLCGWAIQLTISRYEKRKVDCKTPTERGELHLGIECISSILQTNHFQLVYKTMFKEVSKPKKKDFNINLYHASIVLFQQYLEIIREMTLSFADFDRKNAEGLLAHLFRHDICKIIKVGFYLIHHDEILQKLIILTNSFFRLLQDYSRGGRVMVAHTNRVIRRKTKGVKGKSVRNEELGEEEEDEEEGEQNAEFQFQNTPVFQERRYTMKSEFSYLAEYGIIKKHLSFLEGTRYISNPEPLNIAIFEYLARLDKLLDGAWLFFQADTMLIFEQILTDKAFLTRYENHLKFMVDAAFAFVELLKINPLALVEGLFRYSSVNLKNAVLSNYNCWRLEEDEEEEGGIKIDLMEGNEE